MADRRGGIYRSSRTQPREPSQEQADERHLDRYLARLHLPFVIHPQAAIAHQPRETPLHHPASRLDGEALRLRVAPDDLQLPAAAFLAPARQLLAGVRAIRPDLPQARDEWGQS